MKISEFFGSVPGFYDRSAVDQLLAFAWFMECQEGRGLFDATRMKACFKELAIDPPDMSVYLPRLASKRPPQLVKEHGNYRLAPIVRRSLDVRFGSSPTTVAVAKSLSDLPLKIPNLAEREFLNEAISCYKVKAYRAAVVMMWNLTYDHLVNWIFADASRIRLLELGVNTRFPKKNLKIVDISDTEDLKESELIEAARTAKLLDKNTAQILKEKLGRRNMSAHPSKIVISQHSADDMISDLVHNVILKLI